VSSSLQSSLSFLKLGDWRSGTAAIHWDEFGRGKLQYFRQLKNHRLRPKFSKDEYSSIECIVFPWLEPGAGLEGLGVGVAFDSTDLFGHRMLPQLRGLKREPEQVLLWEGERERENFKSFHCFPLAFFPSRSYCAVYFIENVWKDYMHLLRVIFELQLVHVNMHCKKFFLSTINLDVESFQLKLHLNCCKM